MSGVFGWLDTLTTQVGNVAGKAVDVVGSVAATTAQQAADTQNDQTKARPVATAQVAFSGGQVWLYVGVGAAVLIAAAVLLRRR
jgi:hypothetical protein